MDRPEAGRSARCWSGSTRPGSTRPTGGTGPPGGCSGDSPFGLGWDVSGVVEAVGLGVTAVQARRRGVRHAAATRTAAGTYAEYVTVAGPASRPQAGRARPRGGRRAAAGRAHRVAGAGGHRRRAAGSAGADPRGGGRGRPPRRADRQGARRVRHRHRQRGQARLRPRPRRRRGRSTTPQVDFVDAVRDVDVVLDTIGGDYGPRSLRTLRAGGIVVSLASPAEAYLASEARALGVRAEFMIVEADHAGMRAIAELVETGGCAPRSTRFCRSNRRPRPTRSARRAVRPARSSLPSSGRTRSGRKDHSTLR